MAKKFSMGKELKKARELLASDGALRALLEQIAAESKALRPARHSANERLRVPYVDAIPLDASSWK